MSDITREGAVSSVCLAVLQGWFQQLVMQSYPLLYDAHLLFFSAHPPNLISPQLEPVGKKTDNQQIGNEISLKCPSEVNYKRVCIFMVVLGVAGSLLVLSPTAWSTVSVSQDGGLEVNFLTVSQNTRAECFACLASMLDERPSVREAEQHWHWSGWLG